MYWNSTGKNETFRQKADYIKESIKLLEKDTERLKKHLSNIPKITSEDGTERYLDEVPNLTAAQQQMLEYHLKIALEGKL